MKSWSQLPHLHHIAQISDLTLPLDAIKADIEALPPPPQPKPEPPALTALKSKIKPFSHAPLASLPELRTLSVRVRQDQKTLSADQKNAFIAAVNALVQSGEYRTLVLVHANMDHNMHGSMGAVGMQRFLPWHRRYLLEFEEALMAAHTRLGGTAPLALPYWHWPDPFPDWLEGFLPQAHPQTGVPVPARRNASPPQKPSTADESYIVENFMSQLPGVLATPYLRFTYGLEGWGRRADNTSLPAHNHVHSWVGGIMNNTSFSPADPVFWLHHAEVDRLWALWQTTHAEEAPSLHGDDLEMGPWPSTYDDVSSVEGMGYIYAPPT
jgi:tyrosinase